MTHVAGNNGGKSSTARNDVTARLENEVKADGGVTFFRPDDC